MTSRAGPTKRRRARSLAESRAAACRRTQGVTLLELMLVLSLVVALVGATVVTFGSGRERRRFLEASRRFETLFRMARATAANEGRRLRISFGAAEDPSPEVRVLWEPDPLEEPDEFVPYNAVAWSDYVPTSGEAIVISVRRIGDSAYRVMEEEGFRGESEDDFQFLTFHPDGSGDSALLELRPVEDSSALRSVLRLDGPTGTIESFLLLESELEEVRGLIEQGTYAPPEEELSDG